MFVFLTLPTTPQIFYNEHKMMLRLGGGESKSVLKISKLTILKNFKSYVTELKEKSI
jgi:hypothetical protein